MRDFFESTSKYTEAAYVLLLKSSYLEQGGTEVCGHDRMNVPDQDLQNNRLYPCLLVSKLPNH